MRKTRPNRRQRRDVVTPLLLLGALGFGATVASPVVFPESPSALVVAQKNASQAQTELFAVPPEGKSVAFYRNRFKAIRAELLRVRLEEGETAEKLAQDKSRAARVAILNRLIDEPSLQENERSDYINSYLSAVYSETRDVDGLEAYIAAEKAKTPVDEQRVAQAESALSYLYLNTAPTRDFSAAKLFEIGDGLAALQLENGKAPAYFHADVPKRLFEIKDGQKSSWYRRDYFELRQTVVTIWDYYLMKPLFNSAYGAIFRNLADAADLPESDRAEYFKRYAATLSVDEAKARLEAEEAKPDAERSAERVAVLKAAVDGTLGVEPHVPLVRVEPNEEARGAQDYFTEALLEIPDDRKSDFYQERLIRLERSAKRAPVEFSERLVAARRECLRRLANDKSRSDQQRGKSFETLISATRNDFPALRALYEEAKETASPDDAVATAQFLAVERVYLGARLQRATLSPFHPNAPSDEERAAELVEIEAEFVRLAQEEGDQLAAGGHSSFELIQLATQNAGQSPEVAVRLREQITAARADAVAKALPDDSPFDGFDETLLELPNAESAKFYLQRLEALEAERVRSANAYRKREEERDVLPSMEIFVEPGNVRRGGKERSAKPEELSYRYFATVAELYRRLAAAPELEPTVQGEYYLRYLTSTTDSTPTRRYWGAQERGKFYAERLAEETAKTPVDLRRAIVLSDLLEREGEEDPRDRFFTSSSGYFPLNAVEVAKVCNVPSGENVEFYKRRLDRLQEFAFQIVASQKNSPLLRRGLPEEEKPLAPVRDEIPFLRDISSPDFSSDSAPDAKFAPQIADALLDSLRRLAFADDANPFARFVRLQRYADALAAAGKIEKLRDEIYAEIAREKASPVDALREPMLRFAVVKARWETFKQSSNADSADGALADICAEFVDRADDGVVPWLLDRAWSQEAEAFAEEVAAIDSDAAKRFAADVCARLADSESAVDRAVVERLKARYR